MINGKCYCLYVLFAAFGLTGIVVWFSVMGNIVPFKILFLVFPAIEVVPDLRFGNAIMSLFTLLCVGIACGFHTGDFRILLKR